MSRKINRDGLLEDTCVHIHDWHIYLDDPAEPVHGIL